MSAAASMPAGAPASAAVQRVHPARQPGWDAWVAAQPHGSFFHSAAWAKVLESAYGYTPIYFTMADEGGMLRSAVAVDGSG